MKFMSTKNELLEAISIAAKTLATTNSPIQSLLSFRLTVENDLLKIESTNLSEGTTTTMSISAGENGTIMVEGRIFVEVIKKLPDAMIMIEKKDTTFVIDCGATHFELKCVTEEFPMIPYTPKAGVELDGLLFKSLIERAGYATSDSNVNPIFGGINITFANEQIQMVTIDGYRFAVGCEKKQELKEGEKFDVIIEATALINMVKSIKKNHRIELIVDEHMFYLKTENTVHFCRLIEGLPVDVAKFMPQDPPAVVLQRIDRHSLIQCVERSLILKSGANNLLECSISSDTLSLKVTNEIGTAHEEMAVTNSNPETGFKFGINGRFFLEALKHYPSETININLISPVAPILIASDEVDDTAFILPIRTQESA